jgi:hypothetical protein
MLGSLVDMPKHMSDLGNFLISSLTPAGMSLFFLHRSAVLIITSRDKHHPTGVSFNKARRFKLKSMKNPRTKAGPALAVPSIKAHKEDVQHSAEVEDYGALSDCYDRHPLQAHSSHRAHAVAAPDEGLPNGSAQSVPNTLNESDLPIAAGTSGTLINDASMGRRRLHTGQSMVAVPLNFKELAFPREINSSDLVYDVNDGTTYSQGMEQRSVIPSTVDPREQSNLMLQSGEHGNYDILRVIQRIAEGRMSSGGLPASMKLYVAGMLESSRADGTLPSMNESSNETRSRNTHAQINRVTICEDDLILDDRAMAEDRRNPQQHSEGTLGFNHHFDLPASTELTESVFAVALGRSFATAHEGKLVTDSHGGDLPTLPHSTLRISERNDYEHLYPVGVESCLRIMPGMADLPSSSSSMFDAAQNGWSFPLNGLAYEFQAQSLPSHDSTFSDLSQMVNRGIPTVGDLSYLFKSGCGAHASASNDSHDVARRHNDVQASLSLQDTALSCNKWDLNSHVTPVNMP